MGAGAGAGAGMGVGVGVGVCIHIHIYIHMLYSCMLTRTFLAVFMCVCVPAYWPSRVCGAQ